MSDAIPKQLEEYRAQIDALDVELLDVLVRRFDVVRAVGALKKSEAIAVVQSARAEEVTERAAEAGAERGIDPEFMRTFYEMMIDYAHVMEHAIVGADDRSDLKG